MATDYTRSEVDIIVDLIRQDNQRRPLTSAQVSFGVPNVFTPVPGVTRNTVVVVTARPGQTLEGSYDYYYNRVPLSKMVDPRVPDILTFVITDEVKLSDLLPEINQRLGINLTVTKIFDRELPDFNEIGESGADIELKVTPNSLVYTDSIMLRIEPTTIPLMSVIRTTALNGLTYQPPA